MASSEEKMAEGEGVSSAHPLPYALQYTCLFLLQVFSDEAIDLKYITLW